MNQRIDELRILLRDDPSSRRFFLFGDLLRKAGELDEAEEILTGGLKHHPRYVAAWVSLGRIQLNKAQFSEAERSFARALELDPENAVAARLIGETAERIGEWVRAIKAFKLARALNPGDADLEARIDAIERRLAGGPDALDHESLDSSIEVVPPELPKAPAPVQPLTPPEPLIVDEPFPDVVEPFPQAVTASRPREVILISEDDPFAVTTTDDTAVWMAADDVFAHPETSFDSAADDVFGAEPIPLPPPEPPPVTVTVTEPGLRSRPSEEKEGRRGEAEGGAGPIGYESGRELRPGRPPVPESEPVPVPEAEFSHEFPLPTVTLARLALQQDDRPLAEETLQAVLERDPSNREAAELLEYLSEEGVLEIPEPLPSDPSVSQADLLAAKAQRLKGWMEDVRTAAERRAP